MIAQISHFALALAFQAAAPALPTQDDVRQAVSDVAASRCGDDDACIARQPAVAVRAVACTRAGEDLANCRYETRTGAAAWRAATSRFRFDIETQMWFLDDAAAG